ncbi:hypothetical protein ARMGADRAFT_1013421, partial [Armillaria gallica]
MFLRQWSYGDGIVDPLFFYCTDRHWVNNIDLDFIRHNAPGLLSATTVDYLKNTQLRGLLFEEQTVAGTMSSIDTKFYVDRGELLAALAAHIAS